MAIQQAWGSTFDPNHQAIDFIKGELDNSRTWKSFSVLAAADGKACSNPPSRIGIAVLLTHSIGDEPIGSTYYGHLEKSEKAIPECSTGKTVSKSKGDKIGDAGATGAQDKNWKHLHFQVNDANGNPVDPYGIQGERDIYPDPNFKNGKPCGSNALFTECYPTGAVVAGPKDGIPPISGKVTEKKVESQLEEGWTRFKSSVLPYQIDYPSDWSTSDWDDKEIFGDYFLAAVDEETDGIIGVPRVLVIVKRSTPDGFTLNDYREQMVNETMRDFDYLPIKDPETVYVDGQKAWKIEYEGFDLDHGINYLFIKEGEAWEIFFGSHASVFNKELPGFEKMLASFKLLDGPILKPTPTRVSEEQVEINWTRFKSFDLPYQIDYPSNWQQSGNEFYGETTKDNPIRFEVASEPVASWITIDDYKNRLVQSVKDVAKFVGGNAQITETPNQSIAGQKAWRLDGHVTSSITTPNRSVTYIAIKDGIAWVIVYAADSSEFNQNFPTFEKMLASFKFLK